MKRLFIIHHGLSDLHSHYYGEALGWVEACRERGISPCFYINRRALAQVVMKFGAKPVFPYPSDAIVERDPDFQQLADFITLGTRFAEACTALEVDGIGGDDLVIVPYATERDVFGAALWLERLLPVARPTIAFVFMVPDFRWHIDEDRSNVSGDMSYFRYAASRILAVLPPSRLIFNAIDPRLCKVISTATRHPCSEAPVGTYFPSEEDLTARDVDEPPSAHVGVMGEFRPEKGSLIVADVLLRFAALRPKRPVSVQVRDQAQATALHAYFRKKGMCSPFFLYDGLVEQERYLRRLIHLDIVLLPYQWKRYAMRPSGVFSEAVGFGVVAVVPGRTWAADRLAAGCGAGITFHDFSVKAMTEALVAASDGYSVLKERAALSKAAWRLSQSTTALLDKILGQVAAG